MASLTSPAPTPAAAASSGRDEDWAKLARPRSLTDLVVKELRTRIIDGRLRLGQALSESALAADLGISKTPVREALLQLKVERLVDVLPQRGTYVFQMAADQVTMISELREILELAAVASAVKRRHADLVARMSAVFEGMRVAVAAGNNAAYRILDGEFHQAIIELCGNPYIMDAYAQVGFRTQALRSRLSDEAALNRLSFKDHANILKLVKAHDVPALQRLLRSHIRHTARSYLDVLQRRDPPARRPVGADAALVSPGKNGRSVTRKQVATRARGVPSP
jgi:DNA-binding GntR family transcriptional regulator